MKHTWLYAPKAFAPPDDISDAAMYIMHRTFVGKALWQTGNGFTKLKAEYLKEQVGNSYTNALRWLIDNHWLECDNQFIIGHKSRGYRWVAPVDAVRVMASADLSAKINKRSRKSFRQYTKAHRHLIQWLPRFSIDKQASNAHICQLRDEGIESVLTDHEYQDAVRACVKLIADGAWEVSVCDYGRFHSPYTRLHRELRQYVSYDGMRLVNVDVANSQPLLLGLLALEYVREHDDCLVGFGEETGGAVAGCDSPSPTPPSLYSAQNGRKIVTSVEDTVIREQKRDLPNGDVFDYLDRCQRGTIYEHLMQMTGYADRRQFKDDFFERVIYSTGKRDYELTKVFRATYPTVWETIQYHKAQDYRNLPRAMQRAESRVIIDGVVGTMADKYPDIPVISIHDSLMTTPNNVQLVRELMYDAFNEVGLNPTIKVEECK